MIRVTPKNDKDLAFSGMIWVEDTTGAVVRLSLEIDGNSNLNYIDKLRISQEYAPSGIGSGYICVNSRTMLDIAEINTNASGLLATNIISCRNFKYNVPHNNDFFRERISLSEDQDRMNRSDSFWDNHSHFKLSNVEKRIYARIDSVKNLPSINKWVNIVDFLADGYLKRKYLDWGPYFWLASFNKLEGFRNRIGFRTSNNLSKKFQLESYLGYGYGDKKFKFGSKLDWNIKRSTGTKLTLTHSNDVELIGFSDNDAVTSEDGWIVASNMIGSRTLTYCVSNKIDFNTDVAKGLRTKISVSHRNFNYPSNRDFNLAWIEGDTTENSLTNATATIKIEYEPKVFHLLSSTRRRTIHVAGPTYTFTYMKGFSGFFGSQYNYDRIGLGLSTRKIWPAIGRTFFSIDAAKIFGKIPFPLLNIPLGNRSVFFNKRAFNQMDLFEFVTDQNIQIGIEHHFNGFFFNKIPLIKKLNLREIISSKVIYGTLSEANKSLIPKNKIGQPKFEPIHSFDNVPYWETAFGIENIFKVMRIDAIWRMTHRLTPTAEKPNPRANFSIKASLVIGF
jgi:hypothetical protein